MHDLQRDILELFVEAQHIHLDASEKYHRGMFSLPMAKGTYYVTSHPGSPRGRPRLDKPPTEARIAYLKAYQASYVRPKYSKKKKQSENE